MLHLINASQHTIEEYFRKYDTVIVPVGAIESHGSHNPLGTDTLIPNKIIELMDELKTLVVPTIPYGSSDAHLGFSGTLSLGDDLFYKVIKKITYRLLDLGAKKIIYLNGHGGNTLHLKRVCLKISQKNAQGFILDWWKMIGDLNPQWKGGHGGCVETSANMYINPENVRKEFIQPLKFKDLGPFTADGVSSIIFRELSIPTPRLTSAGSNDGWFGPDDPMEATEKQGADMLHAISEYYIELVRAIEEM